MVRTENVTNTEKLKENSKVIASPKHLSPFAFSPQKEVKVLMVFLTVLVCRKKNGIKPYEEFSFYSNTS